MKEHPYRLLPFWLLTYAFSWTFWFIAAYFSHQPGREATYSAFMVLGLFAPAIIGLVLALASGDKDLRRDYRGKLLDIKRIKPLSIVTTTLLVLTAILVSICLSLLVGQSRAQFSFAEGFSFSIGAIPTLFTLLLAALIEEVAWRGYGFDCFTSRYNYFKATLLFGLVWILWHLPLFLIVGSYQHEVLQASPWFAVNFLLSGLPITFLFTWLSVKNSRSVFACFVFHFLLNFMQEIINMTQVTKCIETFIIAAMAAVLVLADKKLFFGINGPPQR